MARRTSQGVVDGGSTLPSGTAQPDLPPVEAWGEDNLDQRPAKSRSPNGEWSSTLPSPRRSAQLIRATRWVHGTNDHLIGQDGRGEKGQSRRREGAFERAGRARCRRRGGVHYTPWQAGRADY